MPFVGSETRLPGRNTKLKTPRTSKKASNFPNTRRSQWMSCGGTFCESRVTRKASGRSSVSVSTKTSSSSCTTKRCRRCLTKCKLYHGNYLHRNDQSRIILQRSANKERERGQVLGVRLITQRPLWLQTMTELASTHRRTQRRIVSQSAGWLLWSIQTRSKSRTIRRQRSSLVVQGL